jgi:hypothetical protein
MRTVTRCVRNHLRRLPVDGYLASLVEVGLLEAPVEMPQSAVRIRQLGGTLAAQAE